MLVYDCIVVGGGPAGLMAANQLKNLSYLLLEKNERVGKKLMLTGGKRCNVTNVLSKEAFMSSLNSTKSKFLYKALSSFGKEDILSFFKERGLNLKLEQNFKFFPETEKSKDVLSCLIRDIDLDRIRFNQAVKTIRSMNDFYEIETKTDKFLSKNVILCMGSNAYPTTGSSGDMIRLSEAFEIKYKPFSPAEAPIYLEDIVKYKDLQGVSLSTTLRMNTRKKVFEGDLIFTHFGLSGPLILHISELIDEDLSQSPVTLSFSLIEKDFDTKWLEATADNLRLYPFIESLTQKRLAKFIVEETNIENKRLKELSKKDIHKLKEALTNFTVSVLKVEDKEKSFVNAGGVLLDELNPNTMELKKVPGLYVCGESIDLAGPIGGFNITIAMSTGHLAGEAVHRKMMTDNKN